MSRLLLTSALLVTFAVPAFAQDTRYDAAMVTGDVRGVSDYRVRGISRSDEAPAVQGKIQFNAPVGLYGGVGASTVDLGDAQVEGILFGGYKADFDGVQLDGKISYNAYDDDAGDVDLDYWEFVGTAGYDFDVFYGSLMWAASPDYIAESGMSLYYGADVSVPLEYGFNLNGHVGFQFIDDESNYAEDYADWSLGLWYNWAEWDVDFGLQYVDTDIEDDECFDRCDATVVFTAKKPFGW